MATSVRSVISQEQRESLVEAFDNGLNSTRKSKQTEISELAERLGLESRTVKVSSYKQFSCIIYKPWPHIP